MGTSLVKRLAVPPDRQRQAGGGEVGLALAVTAGAVVASALVSARYSPAPVNRGVRRFYRGLEKPPFNPPDWIFGGVWPPLYLALAASGVRILTARRGPARSRAIVHWGGIQVLNAVWLWLGFGRRDLRGMTAESVVTVANAVAYVDAARRVDAPAAWLAAPYVAWVGFAALLSEELWRRND